MPDFLVHKTQQEKLTLHVDTSIMSWLLVSVSMSMSMTVAMTLTM